MLFSATALAQLPGPVRDVINAVIASGHEDTVRTFVDLARTTNPDDATELDTILAGYETGLATAAARAAAA
jgi:putative salt-induced outer membrane protein